MVVDSGDARLTESEEAKQGVWFLWEKQGPRERESCTERNEDAVLLLVLFYVNLFPFFSTFYVKFLSLRKISFSVFGLPPLLWNLLCLVDAAPLSFLNLPSLSLSSLCFISHLSRPLFLFSPASQCKLLFIARAPSLLFTVPLFSSQKTPPLMPFKAAKI